MANTIYENGVAEIRIDVVQERTGDTVKASVPLTMPVGPNGEALPAGLAADPKFVRVKAASSVSRIVSAAATTNATVAKAAAGDLHVVSGYNAAAAVRYIKFYDKATAPTVGTDTPVLTLAVAASSAFSFQLASLAFTTGIAYALTTGAADADVGALTLADIVGLNVLYA